MVCRTLIALGLVALAWSACAEPTCVPVNSELFRMRQPDGTERILVRDRDDPNGLHATGGAPWVGGIRSEGRMINVLTRPDHGGRKIEYCFIDGILRYMSVGDKDTEFPPGSFAAPTNSIESLWPAAELTEEEKAADDMWKGSGRLRLFSRNPNRAALIFVEIALIALGLALFAGSPHWRLHGVLWTLISTLLALEAQSRGGFLALLGGAAILLFFRWRRGLSRRVLICLAVSALVIGGLAVATKTGGRVTAGTVQIGNDRSAQSRLFIWREVPRMIAAAPLGWGLWKSGPAYNGWFEKQDRMHMTGDLFCDHLSRFVEGGFVLGGLYVFIWALVLAWGLGWARRGGSPVPLAVSAAYFVASSFNPMNWWTPGFYLPAAVLAWGVYRTRGVSPRGVVTGQRPRRETRRVRCPLAVTAVVLAGAGVVAWLSPEPDVPIRVGWLGRRIVVGTGEPKVWLVDDGFVLSGDYPGFPGREIRKYYQANPGAEPLGIVSDFDDLPSRGIERLIVTGKRCWDYLGRPEVAGQTVLLTPPFGCDRLLQKAGKGANLQVLTGELAARLTGADGCQAEWVHIVPGAEVYVPGWLDLLVRKER